MPPPFYQPGRVITTIRESPARLCLKRGYRRIQLTPGRYRIMEVWRDEEGWHVPELSDGYTYRLQALDKSNPHCGKRISIWQNDLLEALP